MKKIRVIGLMGVIWLVAGVCLAALPTILFNSTTGSDTAASGAGPATALTGAGASLNATTAVNLSANAPNLSGVAVDGSAGPFVNTTTGQKFAKITGVNDGTDVVTVATAYSVTESGKTWAIGGKRATLNHADSRILLSALTGMQPGWTLEGEDDAALALTSAITTGAVGDATNGPIIIKGSVEGRIWNQTANAAHITFAANAGNWRFLNLKFTNSNVTKSSANAISLNTVNVEFERCIFGDLTNGLNKGIARSSGNPVASCLGCDFLACTTSGAEANGTVPYMFYGCSFRLNGTGILNSSGSSILIISHCLFYGNTADAITITTGLDAQIINNTIHGSGGDGIELGTVMTRASIINNSITGNAGFGINAASGQANYQSRINANNYGAGGLINTLGARNNLTAGVNDLAVDPSYANAAGGNFQIGTALKAMGAPLATRTIGANQTATHSFMDIGAAQREEAGGASRARRGIQ